MELTDAINTLVGIIITLATWFLTNNKVDEKIELLIIGAASLVCSLGTAWAAGQLDFSNLTKAVSTVALVALAAERFLQRFREPLKNTGPVKDKAESGQ